MVKLHRTFVLYLVSPSELVIPPSNGDKIRLTIHMLVIEALRTNCGG